MRLLLLFFPCFLFGAYVKNPASPGLLEEGFWIRDTSFFSIKATGGADDVFYKRMEDSQNFGSHIQNQLYFGTFSLNAKERLDAFASFGSGHWKIFFTKNFPEVFVEYTGFFWETGFNVVVIEEKDFAFSVQTKYLQQGSKFYSGNSNFSAKLWQIVPSLSYQFPPITPYLGLLVTNLDVKTRTQGQVVKLHQKNLVGFVIGASLTSHSFFLQYRRENME